MFHVFTHRKPWALTALAAIGALGLWNAPVLAHTDISPYVKDGQIHTGTETLETSTFVEDVRVFGYDFELAPDDFGADDPGYLEAVTLPTGTSYIPAGSHLAYVVLDDLKYWDGAGDVSFGAAPAGTTFTMSIGGNPRVVGTGTGELLPRYFVNTSGGGMHVHVSSELDATGGDPALGIYLVELQLALVDPANNLTVLSDPAPALPYWAVYNNQMDEALHDAAIDWVNAHLVPEPASVGLLLIGAAGLILRRR